MSRRTAPLLCLFALIAAACAHDPSLSPHDERAALQERERGFLAAMGARQVESVLPYFAEEAVLHVANMPPVEGRAAIGRFYGNVFRFLQSSTTTPERLQVSRSGDLAYSAGRVNNTFAGGEGSVEYGGKYLLIWEKRAEEWAVVFYSVSNDQPERPR
jgi:ketosteroid isomerase-like protein